MAYSSAYAPAHSTVPPPSAPGVSGILPGQQAVNTTRVLSLTGFSKDLKTRDIQAIFVEYEDDRGGYRIKWLDDTGCLIVFNDPMVAKRAFLHLTANPHPHLMPVISTEEGVASTFPKLAPYNGDDVVNVVASVANRPRSRSIAQNNASGTNASGNGGTSSTSTTASPASNASAHHRRMSNSSGGGNASVNGRSFGRASMSQYQMQAIMDEAHSAVGPTTPSSNSTAKDGQVNGTGSSGSPASASNKESPTSAAGGAIDWTALQQQAAAQAQTQAQANRNRTGSASSQTQIPGGQAFSPPTSPERSLGLGQRAGAASPSALRRLVSANRG